jgi:succinate dehydrogenase / fumarate reductase cytochrome b subunit
MSFTNIAVKKLMAFAGIFWFFYVVFHMLSLLNFHFGESAFDGFYAWLNQLLVYQLMLLMLVVLLGFHVIVALSRQFVNNISKGQAYQKYYPYGVPRFVAWAGAGVLFVFVMLHFMQMKLLDKPSLYQYMLELFSQPVMLIIYTLGVITLSMHLHHALTNVLQTLGISSKPYHLLVVLLVLILLVGFISIPMSVIL